MGELTHDVSSCAVACFGSVSYLLLVRAGHGGPTSGELARVLSLVCLRAPYCPSAVPSPAGERGVV